MCPATAVRIRRTASDAAASRSAPRRLPARRVDSAGERLLGFQILMNPRDRQSLVVLLFNHLPVRLAQARRPARNRRQVIERSGPRRHQNRLKSRFRQSRPRLRVWPGLIRAALPVRRPRASRLVARYGLELPDVGIDRPAINSQRTGDSRMEFFERCSVPTNEGTPMMRPALSVTGVCE